MRMSKLQHINRLLSALVLMFCCCVCAHSESAKPSYGVKLERDIDVAEIEGQTYFNVTVELNAADLGKNNGVKITVKDGNNPKKENLQETV